MGNLAGALLSQPLISWKEAQDNVTKPPAAAACGDRHKPPVVVLGPPALRHGKLFTTESVAWRDRKCSAPWKTLLKVVCVCVCVCEGRDVSERGAEKDKRRKKKRGQN